MVNKTVLRQELGDKKYNQLVEKENKFYDNYKAGKRDPKTGQFYYNIDFKDPRKKTIPQKTIDGFYCSTCNIGLPLSRTTYMIQCTRCKTLYKVDRDKLSDEFIVTLVKKEQ